MYTEADIIERAKELARNEGQIWANLSESTRRGYYEPWADELLELEDRMEHAEEISREW